MELEVIALTAKDAVAAQKGGATRLEIVGDMTYDGFSPTPAQVAAIRANTSLPIRVMLRLRDGFSTDGSELQKLIARATTYQAAGADGVVYGFLNNLGEIDLEVHEELAHCVRLPWTFHRAIDAAMDSDRIWNQVFQLSCDQILSAGSARGLHHGMETLIARAKAQPTALLRRKFCQRVLVGGGLQPEHLPWLVKAGFRNFHLGRGVRVAGSYNQPISQELVRSWRELIDSEIARSAEPRH